MLLKQLTSNHLKQLLCILLVVYSIIPTLLNTHLFEYIGWYVTVYLIGAYLRLDSPSWILIQHNVLKALCLNFLLIVLSIF